MSLNESGYVFDEKLLLDWVESRLEWIEDAQSDKRRILGVPDEYLAGYAAAIGALSKAAIDGKFHRVKD